MSTNESEHSRERAPNEIVKTVGSAPGRDFRTIQEWEDWAEGDERARTSGDHGTPPLKSE